MNVSGSQRKENIINNITYIMRSRGETKASLASRTGVTRATIYKILEGKVNNIQRSTVTRIADFFGVACEVIENYDLECIELIEKTLSPEGDKNPAAIPIIPQGEFLGCLEKRVGYLVTRYPLTWYFGDVSNMVALKVESNIKNVFYPGDILIIKRKVYPSDMQLALFYSKDEGFYLSYDQEISRFMYKTDEYLLGTVIEERV
ncbi:transcriptional regulator with XRE-family HTH domain [Erwinia toletana]|uniref:Transcriptional regulator with XRE-family HTH domain n=1 Tax=Winslowiella toletana TaxID=92490 RepID=A0ABS4PD33_9GAMM|nr:helix-turn-helix transcriptional regulator [Winslowiella toletana]MBP2170092.1 transcriptional regulator with XRE-family HTH domain [Winslowiella toletana]